MLMLGLSVSSKMKLARLGSPWAVRQEARYFVSISVNRPFNYAASVPGSFSPFPIYSIDSIVWTAYCGRAYLLPDTGQVHPKKKRKGKGKPAP